MIWSMLTFDLHKKYKMVVAIILWPLVNSRDWPLEPIGFMYSEVDLHNKYQVQPPCTLSFVYNPRSHVYTLVYHIIKVLPCQGNTSMITYISFAFCKESNYFMTENSSVGKVAIFHHQYFLQISVYIMGASNWDKKKRWTMKYDRITEYSLFKFTPHPTDYQWHKNIHENCTVISKTLADKGTNNGGVGGGWDKQIVQTIT